MLQLLQQPWHFAPVPDGAIGDADRAMLAHLYIGIPLDGAPIPAVITRIPSGAKKGHRLGGINKLRGTNLG